MAVISNTRGNPQASDVAVQTATPMIGGASREDAQTVISAVDAELAKLFEDRNFTLVNGGLITFTGTALQFTENLELHVNSRVAGGSPQVISLTNTTRALSASGRMLYAVIDRGAGTATITTDATTLPAVTSANQEVVLIAKRVDAGDGTQRCYFRNGSTYNAGQTARLGSSGSGSGSGEINVISNPSDGTNWVASGAGITVATTTTTSDLPLNGVLSTAIKITPVSGTDYARYRWTMPTALKGKKLTVEWFQHPLVGYAAGDLKLEIYKNSASDYSGSYTEFPLSTDVSGTSSIPAGDGKYNSSFDADTADYYELRIVRTSGTTALNVANVIVGPGIQANGSIVQDPQVLSLTYDNLGTVANSEATYTRYGSRMRVQGRVTTGTVVAGTPAINLPSGFTLNTGSGGLSNQASGIVVGYATVITSGASEVDTVVNYAVFYDGTLTTKLFLTERSQSSALKKHNATDFFANGDILEFDFDVPVAEFLGSGTSNLSSNDVEYLTNTNTSTSASDTTSFGYGSGGVAFVAVSSAGATIKKRVRTQRPMGATKGKPVIEVSPDGILWLQGMFPYMESATERYGMRLVAGGTALTDVDVEFGGDGANGTEAWSAYTTWFWRVNVQQPGVAIGFGLADATSSGLMSASAQTLGGDKSFNGTLVIGAAVTNNFNGQRHTVNGALYSGNVTSTDESGLLFISNNARGGGSNALNGRTDSTTGGAALYLDNRTSASARAIAFYSNAPGDTTSTTGSVIAESSHSGAWSFGPAVTNNFNGQKHTVNGALIGGNVTSTDESGQLNIGTNYYLGGQTANNNRTNTSTTGASITVENRTSNTTGTIYFRTNLTTDGATTTATDVGIVTAQGAWTFPLQPFTHRTRTTNSGAFTSGNDVHVFFGNNNVTQNITVAGTADQEIGTTNGTTATITVAGVYQINTSVEVQRNTGGQFLTTVSLHITVNNTIVASSYHNEQNTVAGTARNTVAIAIKLNVNDVVRVIANSAVTGGTWSIGSATQSHLSVAKIQ